FKVTDVTDLMVSCPTGVSKVLPARTVGRRHRLNATVTAPVRIPSRKFFRNSIGLFPVHPSGSRNPADVGELAGCSVISPHRAAPYRCLNQTRSPLSRLWPNTGYSNHRARYTFERGVQRSAHQRAVRDATSRSGSHPPAPARSAGPRQLERQAREAPLSVSGFLCCRVCAR